ncbi:TonB family protein [Pseudodesulfovibrio sp.]|uniref:cell envelope integrity protein TolA n=1 Tax=unclassified Pseudodesulfovibrio TaxID=2661612 RepID=UPI003B003AC1
MRLSFGLVFSILFHAALACVALFWVSTPSVRVNMDRPVYSVDLVSLAPPPAEAPVVAPVAKTVSKPATPVVEAQAEAPVEVKAEPVVEAKPEPKAEPKPEPKPEVKKPDAREISPKKVEKKKIVKKDEPKKEVKSQSAAKPKAKPNAKPKPKAKSQKTKEQLLAEGRAAAQALVKEEDARKQQALNAALNALKKVEGAEVYGYSEAPGGGGSGLLDLYKASVMNAIRPNWNSTTFDGESNLLVKVEIAVATDGKILSSKMIKSSGNIGLDNSVLSAIQKTKYVPPPKEKGDLVIIVNFNSQDLPE